MKVKQKIPKTTRKLRGYLAENRISQLSIARVMRVSRQYVCALLVEKKNASPENWERVRAAIQEVQDETCATRKASAA